MSSPAGEGPNHLSTVLSILTLLKSFVKFCVLDIRRKLKGNSQHQAYIVEDLYFNSNSIDNQKMANFKFVSYTLSNLSGPVCSKHR